MTIETCPDCGEGIDINADVEEQREHTTPCLTCGSHNHAACQH